MKGTIQMDTKKNTRKKRVTLNLDPQTLDLLDEIVNTNFYDTTSSAIRIMVKKYAKYELDEESGRQATQ